MTLPAETSFGTVGWRLALTALFVLLNGFFVAAEFALVKAHPNRVRSLAKEGHRGAVIIQAMLGNLNLYLSACQLGITLASLILGWLAEPAFAVLLIKLVALSGLDVTQAGWLHPTALVIALAVITTLHMVVGEQAPKVWAIHRSERAALLVAWPLKVFATALSPLIRMIHAMSTGLLKLFGIDASADEHGEVHNVEEIRAMLAAAAAAGQITARQRLFSNNILGLVDLQVRHIMVPRVDVVFLSTDETRAQNLATIRESGHSRYPLGDTDLDQVIGQIHTRDVLNRLLTDQPPEPRDLVRPLPTVPDHQPLSRLILSLQQHQTHCALVVDEHGTTVGMAFLEDAIEEIVGPLYDEFDQQVQTILRAPDGSVEMAGGVPLPDAAEALGEELDDDDDTIGGLVTSRLRQLPCEGDQVAVGSFQATVLAMSRRRVARIKFVRTGSE